MKTANSESHLEPLKAKDSSHSEATLGKAGKGVRARETERESTGMTVVAMSKVILIREGSRIRGEEAEDPQWLSVILQREVDAQLPTSPPHSLQLVTQVRNRETTRGRMWLLVPENKIEWN